MKNINFLFHDDTHEIINKQNKTESEFIINYNVPRLDLPTEEQMQHRFAEKVKAGYSRKVSDNTVQLAVYVAMQPQTGQSAHVYY